MNGIEIVKIFKENHFRATPQRIAVYKYLCENPTHPNIEEIHKNVVKLNPSFSKTTVYNSLKSLEEKGLITEINIDNDCIRYDTNVKLHGHFTCKKCKKIYDFKVKKIICESLNEFDTFKKDVYYSGLCSNCKNK